MNRLFVKGSGVILIICIGSLFACTTRVGDLTMISTKRVSLDRVDLESFPQRRAVEGKTSKWIILFIPLGFPHLEDAIDDALDKGNGDVLIDGVVYAGGWWALLVGKQVIKTKGTVVNTRGAI